MGKESVTEQQNKLGCDLTSKGPLLALGRLWPKRKRTEQNETPDFLSLVSPVSPFSFQKSISVLCTERASIVCEALQIPAVIPPVKLIINRLARLASH